MTSLILYALSEDFGPISQSISSMSAQKPPLINPIYMVILGVLSVSFAAIFVRLSSAPAAVIAFWRLLIATLATALIGLTAGSRLSLPRGQGLTMVVASGGFLALHFWTWFQSLKLTTVASSTVLVATQPLFVILAARILWGERLSKNAKAGLLIAFLGTFLIASSAWTGVGRLPGNALAILAAAMAGAYFLIGSRARSNMEINLYTFWTYLFCTIFLGAIVWLNGYPLGPYPTVDWLAFVGLGLICHIGGHTSFNWALGYVSPSVVSTAVLGEPVGATLWAWLFFTETPSIGELAGGLLVILGLFSFMSRPKTVPSFTKG